MAAPSLVDVVVFDPTQGGKLCGGELRDRDGYCGHDAGHGTNHVGTGRCKWHGGASPIVHGRYSNIKHFRLREKLARLEAEKDPLNIIPELLLMRALGEDFIERFDLFSEALLAWHHSYIARPLAVDRIEALQRVLDECEHRMRAVDGGSDDEWTALAEARDTVQRLAQAQLNKPRQVLDLTAAKDLISETTRIVERIEKIRSQDAVSRPELLRVMTHMARVVETYVKEPGILDRIRSGWLEMHV